jgi:penicillin-binding protein 1A
MARVRRRRDDILRLMVRGGAITEAVSRQCAAQAIPLPARRQVKTEAPAVIENVFEELKRAKVPGAGIEDLVEGRIGVYTTVDNRIQRVVNAALEAGLARYEKRHPRARGAVQGSVVVLANDGRILAEAGGRQVYRDRYTSYSDYNRVTDSRRQPGSVMKPLVYLAAFRRGLALNDTAWDDPVSVPTGTDSPPKWIQNYDGRFKGPIPVRQALAESRNAAAIRIAQGVGIQEVIALARGLGIRTPLQPYVTTALGASEVQLLELANAYRALASGTVTEPYVVDRVENASGNVVLRGARPARPAPVPAAALAAIQEGLRGVVRLPAGTAYALASRSFGIPVMGKTGTSSDFRDALFVGSTFGPGGITVAVRIGFDDNRELGRGETGGRVALPIFREIVAAAYGGGLLGSPPAFPDAMEARISAYVAAARAGEAAEDPPQETLPTLRVHLAAPQAAPAAAALAPTVRAGVPAAGSPPRDR